MKYRAIVQEINGWWIGWLVEIPGVNAQEKTHEELASAIISTRVFTVPSW